jgi:hypothetical protein
MKSIRNIEVSVQPSRDSRLQSEFHIAHGC